MDNGGSSTQEGSWISDMMERFDNWAGRQERVLLDWIDRTFGGGPPDPGASAGGGGVGQKLTPEPTGPEGDR